MCVTSPFAFTPTDLSALQKGTHTAINQPMLITSGHLHGLDKRRERNKNVNIFNHLLLRVGWSITTWTACCVTMSFGGVLPFGGVELNAVGWLATS